MTNEDKQGNQTPSEEATGQTGPGATETVNKAISAASATASDFASGVAKGINDDVAPEATKLFDRLKADAMALPRIGQPVMIGLLLGAIGLAMVFAVYCWYLYTGYVMTFYGQAMAGNNVDPGQLKTILAQRGLTLPVWKPFFGIILLTPVIAMLTLTLTVSLRLAGDGREVAIDTGIDIARRNLVPFLLIGVPFALFALIGSWDFVVDSLAKQSESGRSDLNNSLAPYQRLIPGLPNPVGAAYDRIQENLSIWNVIFLCVQVPLMAWIILLLAFRVLPSVPILAQTPQATWTDIKASTAGGFWLRRMLRPASWPWIGGAIAVVIAGRVLLWGAFQANVLFGGSFLGWVMRLIIALPISALLFSAFVVVVVAVGRILANAPRTEAADTEAA